MATVLQLKVAKRRLFEKIELSALYKHSFEKQCATDHWWRSFTVTMDGQRQLFVEHQAQHLGLFFFVSKFCWFFACIKGVSMSFPQKVLLYFSWCGSLSETGLKHDVAIVDSWNSKKHHDKKSNYMLFPKFKMQQLV